MSILTMEYDVEIAKRVYADERVEDERIEIARSMIKNGEPVEKIIMYTKLTHEEIEKLRANIL